MYELEYLMEKAFSEGYEYAQREFARIDYAGLDKIAAEKLRQVRKSLADNLRYTRKDNRNIAKTAYKLRGPKSAVETITANQEREGQLLSRAKKRAEEARIKLKAESDARNSSLLRGIENW